MIISSMCQNVLKKKQERQVKDESLKFLEIYMNGRSSISQRPTRTSAILSGTFLNLNDMTSHNNYRFSGLENLHILQEGLLHPCSKFLRKV